MKIKVYKIIFFLFFCFIFGFSYAEEPILLSTEKEDISLTDDINVARAQAAKYPDNPEAHFNLAIALTRTSLVEDAIKELRRTKKLIRKPENAGVIDKKITEYNEMIKNNPNANNIRYRLAFSHYLKAYLLSKEIEKIEKQEQEKSSKSKKNKDLFSIDIFSSKRLALIDNNPEIKKNLELSLFNFNELLKFNPSDNWAKIYYAFILAEQYGEINKARSLWNEVVKHEPNNPAPHLFLGELHIKEGRLKEGILEISQALLLRSQGY